MSEIPYIEPYPMGGWTMREIKFRFWDTELGEFTKYYSAPPNDVFQFDQSRYIALQYTGLKDKNGKEIYEGYIVKYEGEYFAETADVVWYGTGSWGLHDREKYLDELIFSSAIRYDSFSGKAIYTEMEVIGNIYENPELVGKK